mmetsp:Transcript_23906/g.55777  ORF Transcript_23906/g.55777 Transcript_23906/m.55777 type:complete len:283 (+) Transcript_23906:73-921(+)
MNLLGQSVNRFQSTNDFAQNEEDVSAEFEAIAERTHINIEDPNPEWERRLSRLDIYEPDFKHSKEEERELMELAHSFGFIDEKDLGKPLDEVLSVSNANLKKMFNSLIVKRGPVTCHGTPHELILFAHGFILARVESSYMVGDKKVQPRVFEACETFHWVKFIEDTSDDLHDVILLKGESHKIQFRLKDVEDHDAWWNAIAKMLIQDRLRGHKALRSWGWQERLIHEKKSQQGGEDLNGSTGSIFRRTSTTSIESRRRSSLLDFTGGLINSLVAEMENAHVD